ncbi:MAG: hypothetical protein ACE5IY_14690 [bacterium]
METTRVRICLAVFLATIGVVCVIFQSVATTHDADEALCTLFEASMNACYEEDFEQALQLALEVRQQYPDDPAGTFGLLTTYQTIQRNYRVKLYEPQIDSLLDLSIHLAKNALKKNKRDGRNYFYLGTALGFRSMFNAEQGKWMDAFKDGSQVLRNFNKAIAYSPDFYDAYYGLGLYKYWLGAKGAIRYLPFARKSRNQGITRIKITIEKGRFLRVNAMYGLLAIYYHEQEFEQAFQLSERLFKTYPRNPTLNYRRGRILQELGRWSEALQSFENLNKILTTTKYRCTSYQIDCLYQMAVCNYKLENYLETQRFCQQAILLEQQVDFSGETDGPIEKFSDIQSELHKLSDQVKTIVVSGVSDSE